MQRPPETPPKRSGDWSWSARLERAFIAFSFYALSIGPLYWHWYRQRFVEGGGPLALFYEPLFRLANLIPPFGDWMNDYIGWWIFHQG